MPIDKKSADEAHVIKGRYFDSKGMEQAFILSNIINMQYDTWKAGNANIISFKGCQKIADKLQIIIIDKPEWIQVPDETNLMNHIVQINMGYIDSPTHQVFVMGEASRLNTGKFEEDRKTGKISYKERGIIDAQYRASMAWKRAFCKGVLELTGLRDKFYAEDESTSFAPPVQQDGTLDYNNL